MDASIREIDALVLRARGGSAEAVWELLAACREYLLACTTGRLTGRVRTKTNPSDVVGDVILEARRDFSTFRGVSRQEWLGWLRRILLRNLANVRRSYFHAQKRAVTREVRLKPANLRPCIDVEPAELLWRSEEWEAFRKVLQSMPTVARQIFILRHRDGLSFRRIGERLDVHPDQVRRLCAKAVRRLRRELDPASR
jgi:RNA polymerase sigma-70 factor (subfamily 1)